jgi:Flp pilus assembly protein TadG
MSTRRSRLRSAAGQSLLEMALVLPITMVVSLGLIEISYALLHQHVVSRMSREGANLISRDVTLLDAGKAMLNMTTTPVDLAVGSNVVFTVLKKGSAVGTANYDRIVVYQRYSVGALAHASSLITAGAVVPGASPDFQVPNSDTNPNLRVTNLPATLDITRGGLLYVTEVFTTHESITPLSRFGVTVPPTLTSIAYF